jgi:hypothetical protein
MGAISIKGHKGEIRWVYLPAIVFGPWSYHGEKGVGTLTAQIVSCDEFRMKQLPLVAVVPAGRAEWRWAVSDLQISGTTLTASLVRL